MGENENSGLNRREFLRKAAITGAVAWAIPVVQSVAATPAYAFHQGTPHPCPHSTPDVSGQSCQATCIAKCGGGSGCTDPRRPGTCADCRANVCPESYCNPNCWVCAPEPHVIC
jgi:hypothetical protein